MTPSEIGYLTLGLFFGIGVGHVLTGWAIRGVQKMAEPTKPRGVLIFAPLESRDEGRYLLGEIEEAMELARRAESSHHEVGR